MDRLLVPTDSEHRKCGVDNSVIDKPHLLFFDLEKCIDARVPLFGCKTTQVCVEKCPTSSFIFTECNNNIDINQLRKQLICQLGINVNDKSCPEISTLIDDGKCARWYLPSKSCKFFSFFLFCPHFYFHLFQSICQFCIILLFSLFCY